MDRRGYVKRNSGVKSRLIQMLFPVKKTSKRGSGLLKFAKNTSSNRIYQYYDNYDELVQRLHLLKSSELAGHSAHDVEIASIIEELREGKIIV